jgi:hypothetical protein
MLTPVVKAAIGSPVAPRPRSIPCYVGNPARNSVVAILSFLGSPRAVACFPTTARRSRRSCPRILQARRDRRGDQGTVRVTRTHVHSARLTLFPNGRERRCVSDGCAGRARLSGCKRVEPRSHRATHRIGMGSGFLFRTAGPAALRHSDSGLWLKARAKAPQRGRGMRPEAIVKGCELALVPPSQ